MNRTRSRNRLMETAFVGHDYSSTEDLDEIDRLANHPVLRCHQPLANLGPSWRSSLRKSRSETGDALLGGGRIQNPLSNSLTGVSLQKGPGLSVWHASASQQGSPTSAQIDYSLAQRPIFGRSRGALPRGPIAQSHLSKSTTFNSGLLASPLNGSLSATSSWVYNPNTRCSAQSAPTTPPKWSSPIPTSAPNQDYPPPLSVRRPWRGLEDHMATENSSCSSTQHVVHAVIENVRTPSNRECFTPPPNLGTKSNETRDSLAQTPPNTAPLPVKFGRLPQNLLRQQQEALAIQSMAEDSSSNNEVAGLSVEKSPCALHEARFKLALSVRARIRLDPEDSSSAESTPQKHQLGAGRAGHALPSSSSASMGPSRQVRRGTEMTATVRTKVAPKPILDLALKTSSKSKFFSSGESSCSSAMSSLESIRSTTSDGMQSFMSSESGAVSSMSSQSSDNFPSKPTLELGPRHAKLGSTGVSSKFQVLSPISDKSQEQYSEAGEQGSNKTPTKVSPSSTLTPSSVEAHTVIDNEHGGPPERFNNNVASNDNESTSRANDNEHSFEDVPWDMPKLKRRLQNQSSNKNLNLHSFSIHRHKTLELRGSDSGISLASQDLKDMKELLNVPWDMPKLRKKTLHQQQKQNFFNSRPQSMPVEPAHHLTASESSSCQSSNENMILPQPVPPPPPGFEDSGDEFYLGDSQSALSHPSPALQGTPERRGRPKMTLSFGVDPSLKTLMFATNSPFGLNDCEDVDPNLSLDRQECYHGAITRTEAEERLRSLPEGNYLVRAVDSGRQEFALSLKSARGYMHMKIRRNLLRRDFQLSDFEKTFMSVPQMIHHYTRNRLPIKGAEHMCLKHPVREEML